MIAQLAVIGIFFAVWLPFMAGIRWWDRRRVRQKIDSS